MAGDSAAATSWSNLVETKREMRVILVDKELVESEVVVVIDVGTTVVGVAEALEYGLSRVCACKVGIFEGSRGLLGWPRTKGLKYWY